MAHRLEIHPDSQRSVMSHHPYLNQGQPSKEPCSLLRGKVLRDQVRCDSGDEEMPVHLRHGGVLRKHGVLLVEPGRLCDVSGLPVVNDHRSGGDVGKGLLLRGPLSFS